MLAWNLLIQRHSNSRGNNFPLEIGCFSKNTDMTTSNTVNSPISFLSLDGTPAATLKTKPDQGASVVNPGFGALLTNLLPNTVMPSVEVNATADSTKPDDLAADSAGGQKIAAPDNQATDPNLSWMALSLITLPATTTSSAAAPSNSKEVAALNPSPAPATVLTQATSPTPGSVLTPVSLLSAGSVLTPGPALNPSPAATPGPALSLNPAPSQDQAASADLTQSSLAQGSALAATKFQIGLTGAAQPALAGNTKATPVNTVSLGNQYQVLTTASGAPTNDSLAAFARAQGLDEQVVQWLVGHPGAAGISTAPVKNTNMPPADHSTANLTSNLKPEIDANIPTVIAITTVALPKPNFSLPMNTGQDAMLLTNTAVSANGTSTDSQDQSDTPAFKDSLNENAFFQPMTANPTGHQNNLASASNSPDNVINLQGSVDSINQKVMDAIANKVQSEFNNGHWQIRLQLNPEHMGHIDVQLKSSNQTLEASFTASQEATRNLLNDGSDRLRESLQRTGMDVASISIGDSQSRQTGGDSTPRQSQPFVSNAAQPATLSSVTESQSSVMINNLGADGLDVMV